MKSLFLTMSFLLLFFAAVPSHFAQRGGIDGRTPGAKSGVLSEESGMAGVTISAPTTTRGEGVTFDAVFNISDVNGLGIITYQMDVQYSPSVLQFNSCSVLGTISSGGIITCNNSAPGTVEIVWTSTAALVNGAGGPPSSLFRLSFTVIGSNGSTSPLTFTEVQVMEFAVPAVGVPGAIIIGAPTAAEVAIAGRVTTGTGRGVSNARVTVLDGQGTVRYAITNGFGYYKFPDVPADATYVVSVVAKRYTFAPRTVNVADELVSLDFVAEP